MAISGLTGKASVFNTPSKPFTSPSPSPSNNSSNSGSSSSGKSSGGSGRSSSGGSNAQPDVKISGNEVFINGQGFSVASGKMGEFLTSKGIGGSSLDFAKQQDSNYAKQNIFTPQKSLTIQTLQQSKNPANTFNKLNANIVNPQSSTLFIAGQPNNAAGNLFTQGQTFVAQKAKESNVMLLTNEAGNKVDGVEYGGKSWTKQGFENAYGVKVLYDDKAKEFFFGTVGANERKSISTISAGYTPITKKEKQDVSKTLLKAKIVAVAKGELSALDAITNQKINASINKYGMDLFTTATSALDKHARAAKEMATQVLNESDFKTGNKAIDRTAKTLGWISYFGGSAGAYALNMISGVGNLASGLAFNTSKTLPAVVVGIPAMLKSSLEQVGRTATGNGTIEDFFGTAMTLATVVTTTYQLSKLKDSIKLSNALKKELAAERKLIKESQKILRQGELSTQKVYMKNANQFNTLEKIRQKFGSANAKTNTWAATSGDKTSVISRTTVNTKYGRMIVYSSSESTSSKIFSYLKRTRTNNAVVEISESYYNNPKVATYLSKMKTRVRYVTLEATNGKGLTVIDGKGNAQFFNTQAQIDKFVKTAKFGKFSFTGKRGIGGNIDIISKVGEKGFRSTGGLTRLGYRNSAGVGAIYDNVDDAAGAISKVAKKNSKIFKTLREPSKADMAKIYLKNGKNLDKWAKANPDKIKSLSADLKKIYGTSSNGLMQEMQPSLQLPANVGISKSVSGSVVANQLKTVAKNIGKVVSKSDLVVKAGYRAVVGSTGLMFFNNNGQLVSPKIATKSSAKQISVVREKIKDIVADAQKPNISSGFRSGQSSSQGSAQNIAQVSNQKSGQESRQELRQSQKSGIGRGGFNFNIKTDFKPKIKIPNIDRKNKQIVKNILGSKLAPSYSIYIGSGKKIKKIAGRYTPQDAISKGTFTIDRTKERTVRIVPNKLKPNMKFKRNYLAQANYKFRNYRISKGQRVKYSSTRLIEKSKYFNDLEKFKRKRK